MWRLTLIGAGLAAAACAPSLEEGFYGCESGACPDGWHCWSDDLCRSTPEPLGAFGESCRTDDDCESGACAEPIDPMARDMPNLCSLECVAREDCGSTDRECAVGYCRQVCIAQPDCPDGFGCHIPVPPPPERPRMDAYCIRLINPDGAGDQSCTDQPECRNPAFCVVSDLTINGVCSMLCETTEHCPGDGRCITVMTGHRQCLLPCDTDDDCQDPLFCRPLGDTGELGDFCIPEQWAGQPLPLPGDPRPPPPGM